MRKLCAVLLLALTLTACDEGDHDVSYYAKDTNKRMVNVDDHKIYVVPTGWHSYVAWGGANDRDGQIQYRQRRAIELVSKCRISHVSSKKTDTVLHASVKC